MRLEGVEIRQSRDGAGLVSHRHHGTEPQGGLRTPTGSASRHLGPNPLVPEAAIITGAGGDNGTGKI